MWNWPFGGFVTETSILGVEREVFNYTYELIFENDSERLYRLKEEKLRESLELYDIDKSLVPSLNSKMVRWDTVELSEYLNNKMDRIFTLLEGSESLTASVSATSIAATVQ